MTSSNAARRQVEATVLIAQAEGMSVLVLHAPSLIPSQPMAKVDLKAWARVGAESRVRELTAELAQIYSVFPDLKSAGGVSRRAVTKGAREGAGRKPMSAAQKKAVSLRMKKYWAARRASPAK